MHALRAITSLRFWYIFTIAADLTFTCKLHIPFETLHIHKQQNLYFSYPFTSYAKLFHGLCPPSATKVFNNELSLFFRKTYPNKKYTQSVLNLRVTNVGYGANITKTDFNRDDNVDIRSIKNPSSTFRGSRIRCYQCRCESRAFKESFTCRCSTTALVHSNWLFVVICNCNFDSQCVCSGDCFVVCS